LFAAQEGQSCRLASLIDDTTSSRRNILLYRSAIFVYTSKL
jgi:hypothetical protein